MIRFAQSLNSNNEEWQAAAYRKGTISWRDCLPQIRKMNFERQRLLNRFIKDRRERGFPSGGLLNTRYTEKTHSPLRIVRMIFLQSQRNLSSSNNIFNRSQQVAVLRKRSDIRIIFFDSFSRAEQKSRRRRFYHRKVVVRVAACNCFIAYRL